MKDGDIAALLRENGAAFCSLPNGGKALFSNPSEIIETRKLSEVKGAFEKIEKAAAAGLFAAGFVAYEAAPAFDPALKTREPDGTLPLLRFGLYASCRVIDEIPRAEGAAPSGEMLPELSPAEYSSAVENVKKRITEGDIYQANFTYRASSGKTEDPAAFFLRLAASHPVPEAAFFNCGDFQIASLSPELFISKNGSKISGKPMKGTAPRLACPSADSEAAEFLPRDPKNRAENLMIADMTRNDFGRICRFGSVKAEKLFSVESYRTCHQMVSEISGELRDGQSLFDIFAASFPAASITGAPKVKAAEIISLLEKSPRGVYTGATGAVTPQKDFRFNVAIRTVTCFKDRSVAGIGGGIVADSLPASEWEETLVKSRFIFFNEPDFETLETMLWEQGKDFLWPEEHLSRARETQKYFGRQWKEAETRVSLAIMAERLQNIPLARVRLLLAKDGSARTEFFPLESKCWPARPLKLKVSEQKTDPSDPFLTHKTNNRKIYDAAFKDAHAEGFDEAVFTNLGGELTECAISNIFLKINGRWLTPPVKCGLLPGIWRAKTIAALSAEEKVLTLTDLRAAEEIMIGNSVRGAGKGKLERA